MSALAVLNTVAGVTDRERIAILLALPGPSVDMDAYRRGARTLRREEERAWTWLYFIQQGEDGPIKIGVTEHPQKRLSVLQNASPVDLKVRALIWRHKDAEKAVHELFAYAHMRGEWYRPVPDLITLTDFFYEWDTIEEMVFGKNPYPGVDFDSPDWDKQFDAVMRQREAAGL